ncbi:hypothetical protein K443DRAFT_681761 [Laccaria amethystina LaAM-08-1]|uniref:Uncharacterized protein n=1 Tax=Laccaria amethystina LaAM-08-1 TaxID=1095629 RepID=A0A0C9XHH3_9AGAR|nr:hypothetical protein K443DRAFT_681761 [Laccaria amethystina LaAM-08-1]
MIPPGSSPASESISVDSSVVIVLFLTPPSDLRLPLLLSHLGDRLSSSSARVVSNSSILRRHLGNASSLMRM